jgi:ABC-type Fe3+/spermidine/putrescine transport system ATPase subunit
MSVGQNVGYALKAQKVKKPERIKLVDKYLAMVQLEGFANRRIDELSGGQQQRVALARSVAGNPKVLLLDEPFSGLDETLRDDMRRTVKALHDELKMTTVMITHDANEALQMSDEIVYMKHGEIIQTGTPEDLYSNPKVPDIVQSFGDCLTVEGKVDNGLFCSDVFSCVSEGVADGAAVAVARNNAIDICESTSGPNNNEINLRITDCRFSGENYVITADSGKRILTLKSSNQFEAGSLVTVKVNKKGTFVFHA